MTDLTPAQLLAQGEDPVEEDRELPPPVVMPPPEDMPEEQA